MDAFSVFSVRFHEASRLWSPRLVAMERFASRLSIWMGPSDWHLGRQISSAPRLLQVTYTETHSPCRWIHPSPKTRRVTVSTQTWTLRVTVKRHRRLRLLRLLVPLFPPPSLFVLVSPPLSPPLSGPVPLGPSRELLRRRQNLRRSGWKQSECPLAGASQAHSPSVWCHSFARLFTPLLEKTLSIHRGSPNS